MDGRIDSLVKESVCQHPDKIAVVFDDHQAKSFLTYKEFWSRTEEIAKCISQENTKGSVIGICIDSNVDLPSILCGVLKSSCSFYPFTTDSKSFISYSINSIGVQYLLVNANKLEDLKDIMSENHGEVIPSSILFKYNLVFIALNRNHVTCIPYQSDLAYCITTSGTTSTPKTVSVPHRCIVSNLLALRELFSVSSEDCLFLASPLTFDPSMIEMYLSMISGARILIIPDYIKQIPNKLLDILYNRNSVTILQATPSLLYQCQSSELKRTLLGNNTSLRIIALGGEEFPPLSVVNQWKEQNCPVQFYNLYGITEVSCWSNCYHITHEDFRLELNNIPIGEPLNDIEIKVTNKDGERISHAEGLLWIGSKERKCYIDKETRDISNNDIQWRYTGDIVRILDNSNIIYLYRADTQIKRHGKRLDLSTIQKCVMEVDDVKQCYVIYDENKLCIFIVSEIVYEGLETRVMSFIQNKLPLYYHPDSIQYIQSLPLTSHGKIDRKKLIKIMNEESRDINIPTTLCHLTRWLRELWQKHISLACQCKEEIIVEDFSYFIMLGGNSLQAVYLTNFIQSLLHSKYPVILDSLLNQTFSQNVQSLYNIVSSDIRVDKTLKQKQNGDVIENGNPKKMKIENDVGLRNGEKDSEITLSSFDYFICRGNRIFQCVTPVTSFSPKRRTGQCCKTVSKSGNCADCDKNSSKFVTENSSLQESQLIQERPVDVKAKVKLQSMWKYDTGKCVDSSPCVAVRSDGSSVVFIGSHSYKFTALDVDTGDMIWEIYLGDRIESSPCLSNCGTFVIVGCYDGMLYVINVNNGDIKWRFQTGSQIKSSPILDPLTSLVVFGSHDQCLYAVDVINEECKWKCRINNGSLFSTPLLYSGIVYIGTLGGQLLAVNMEDGSIKWRLDLKKPIFSSPCYLLNSIIVASVNGCVYSVSLTGNVIWTFQTQAPVFCSPVIFELLEQKCVIIGSHDNCLYCLDPSGQLIWKFKSTSNIYSTPFVYSLSNKTKFMSNKTNFTSNKTDYPSNRAGSNRTDYPSNRTDYPSNGNVLTNGIYSNSNGISVSNNTDSDSMSNRVEISSCASETYLDCVISASTNGDLNVLSLTTGELLLNVKLPGELFSSPVIYQNKLLLGCRENHLYCFQISH